MTDGLKNIKYALLQQESDPLEFCVCPLPIPSQIGIPCFPCELPNNFRLFQSNENYQQIGMVKQNYGFRRRIYLFKQISIFPFIKTFHYHLKRFLQQYSNLSEKRFFFANLEKVCLKKNVQTKIFLFSCRPNVQVQYEGNYAGKVQEPFGLNFCKGKFHELEIYDAHDSLRYKLVASLKQWGLLFFLPFKQCSTISYQIYDQKIQSDEENILGLNPCGQINHLFYGINEEYCSKADQYGICFPDSASEKDKALIVMAAVFIDYLWFENF